MKRLSKVFVAAAILAATAVACFDDPTSSLRNGPSRLQVSRLAATIQAGDSIAVQAVVLDEAGNALPAEGASWSSADETIAAVRVDTDRPAPGDAFTRAFIRGISNQAGVTTVTVSVQGVQASVRVTVLPATFPGGVTITGTAVADTIIRNRPAPQPAESLPYTAGDTITLDATVTVTFNDATSSVIFGAAPGYILSRTATQIKAMARVPYAGPVTVTNLTYAGSAETGPVAVASIQTDSVAIARARFTGGVAVAASAFGPNTELTLTAPADVTFNTSGTTATGVVIAGTAGVVLSRTAGTLTAIFPATRSGGFIVTNANIQGVRVDSIRATGTTSVNASFFPGSVANGSGNLLDTIVVAGAGQATFTTSGTAASQVTVNGSAAYVLRRTADSIRVIALTVGSAPISISNVIVAGTTIPSLQTQNPVAVGPATGEANEPGNNALGTATPLTFTATFDTIFGVMNSGDVDDLYEVTLAAPAKLETFLDFTGGGLAPDIDVLVLDATGDFCDEFGGGFTLDDCTGATGAQPERGITQTLPAGTYYVYVNLFSLGGATGPFTYRMRFRTTP